MRSAGRIEAFRLDAFCYVGCSIRGDMLSGGSGVSGRHERRAGIIHEEEVQTVLVHTDALLACVSCEVAVQTLGNAANDGLLWCGRR